MGFLRRDIQKPKATEFSKERFVGGKMRSKSGRPCEASIHVTEGDHRRNTWKRRGNKERKFVDKVANSLLNGCDALVYGGVLVQSEMEKNIFPLVKIQPLRGGDFLGMRIHRPMPVSRSFALAR